MPASPTIRRLLPPATLAVLAALTLLVACTPSRASTPQTAPVVSSPARTTSPTPPATPATKPSKAEVRNGVRRLVRPSTGPKSEKYPSDSTSKPAQQNKKADRYYDCVVDELYDTLTPEQLRRLADSTLPSDATVELRDAVQLCMHKMGAKR